MTSSVMCAFMVFTNEQGFMNVSIHLEIEAEYHIWVGATWREIVNQRWQGAG